VHPATPTVGLQPLTSMITATMENADVASPEQTADAGSYFIS